MQTSKKILISFVSLCCLVLLSFIITVEGEEHQAIEETQEDLPNFSYIKLTEGAKVTVSSAEMNKIKYPLRNDSVTQPPYELNGDTLILDKLTINDKNYNYAISSSHVKTILNQGGNIHIELDQDSLIVKADKKARVNFNEESSFKSLQLNFKDNTKAYVYSKQISSLTLLSNNSYSYVRCKIGEATIIAKDKSEIRLPKVQKLDIDCDQSSSYKIN